MIARLVANETDRFVLTVSRRCDVNRFEDGLDGRKEGDGPRRVFYHAQPPCAKATQREYTVAMLIALRHIKDTKMRPAIVTIPVAATRRGDEFCDAELLAN